MADRPRHPNKDLEKLLRRLEDEADWKFIKSSKYYKGRCPCGSHSKTVRLTPSGGNYKVNLEHWFMRLDCWPKEVRL